MSSFSANKIIRRLAWSSCFILLASLASCDYFESQQVKLQKVQSLYQKNKFNQVIVITKKMLQSDSGNCKARILLGKSQFAKFSLDDARDTLQKALNNNCHDPSVFFTLAKIYLYRNQLKQAEQMFDNPKLNYASKLPEALQLRADVFFQKKDKASAAKIYADYYSATHDDAAKCIDDTKLRYLDKDYKKVLTEAETCNAKFNSQPGYRINESRYLMALSFVQEKMIDEAVKVLTTAIKQANDPKNPFLKVRASLFLLHLYLEQNDINKAALLANDISRYVVNPDVYYAKGRQHEIDHRIDLAEKQYLASLKLDSGYRPSLLALANIKFREGNIEQARYYTGRADALIGGTAYTNALDDQLALQNLQKGDPDAVINSLSHDNSVRSQYLLALAYARKGDADKTWEIFAKIKKRLNDRSKSDLLEAKLDIALGKTQKATRILLEYTGKGSPEAVAGLSQLYIRQHKYNAAETMLKNVLKHYPANRNTEFLLVELYSKTRQEQKLFMTLDRMVTSHPQNIEFKIYRAKMYDKYGRYQEAIAQCDDLLRNKQASSQANIIKANAYVKLKEYGKAEQVYSTLLKDNSNRVYAYLMLALLAEKQSRPEDALTNVDKALNINPQDIRAIYAKIDILSGLGKNDALRKFADSSAQLFHVKGGDKLILGYAFKKLGDDKQAYGNYKKAIDAGSNDVRIALIVYKLSIKVNGEQAAVHELDEYLQSESSNRNAYLVADYFMKNNNYALAMKYYELFIEHDQSNPVAYNNLAWLKMHAGNLDGALRDAKSAYKLAPDLPAILDTLGQVYLGQGKYNEAGKYFTKAHDKLKDNPTIAYHLAQYYFYAKQYPESRAILSKLIDRRFPEQQAARKLLNKIGH